jgi:hypothetical protein
VKATDFNLQKEMLLNVETGIATFRNNRLVIMDASSLGLLRMTLVKEMGIDKAREIFLKFGYSNGYSDFTQMKKKYAFDSEMDLLASGPVIHTWEGIVKATPKEIKYDRAKGEFYFTGTWTNSWEAEQHLSYYETAHDPVCWTLMGYASGWCTAFFGSPLLAIEPCCVGKGDADCGWLIQPPKAFGKEAELVLAAIAPLYGA